MRYLDPKADLTFKKVFGDHPELVMSLLNALLPLKEGEEITSVTYLPAELVPDTPLKKNSIVDVRCRDTKGRVFIVEMQMVWSPGFMQRVLFNASKAYIRQLNRNEEFQLLHPVYSLNLVNDIFERDMPDTFYHYYSIVHMEHTEKVIDGLHLVFVELPKFSPHTLTEKKMAALWLRFLTEINEQTRQVPHELMDNPEVRKAIEEVEESAFSEAQLLGYDKFWDAVRVEKTLYYESRKYGRIEGRIEGREEGLKEGRIEGREEGLKEGREEGLKEGREEGLKEGRTQGLEEGRTQGLEEGMAIGKEEAKREMAVRMKAASFSSAMIAQATGLSEEEIETL